MGARPLPAVPTPVPPEGFIPLPAYDAVRSRPRKAQVAAAAPVVDELRHFADYEAIFGTLVPAAKRIASVLDFAVKWRSQRDAAETWNTYVRAQDALAWEAALGLLDELKPSFQRAVARDPALAATYPRLATFFAAHKQIAQRATATKKKKAEASLADASDAAATDLEADRPRPGP
jgi:hypothetical protein